MNHAVHQVLTYHDKTKHRLHRAARSLGYLDWDNQPNPFRTWAPAPQLLLPLLKRDPDGQHADLYQRTQNTFWDFNLASVGAFLELSMGLSAWKVPPSAKATGGIRHSRLDDGGWALRMNPSSGNLHPTEAHLLLPPLHSPSRLTASGAPELPEGALRVTAEGGVYHYQSYSHALEQRATLPPSYVERIRQHFQSNGFLIALSSIVWRESWKYGERAYRYCQHDVGHALGALSVAGNLLGWKVTCLNAVSDADIQKLLGFSSVVWPSLEQDEVDVLCFVSPGSQRAIPRALPPDLLKAFERISFQGQPSELSATRVDWEAIAHLTPALEKPETHEVSVRDPERALRPPLHSQSAAGLIRSRRSAVAYDGQTSISAESMLAILDRTLTRANHAPFDLELSPARVHLAVFIHRVLHWTPGLYCLIRNPDAVADLKRAMHRDYLWTPMQEGFPLYLLKEGDFSDRAVQISCAQTIAAKGAFSLGMLAHFLPEIEKTPWNYRSLFWECGMIGQALYLEAEAQGIRGTGIGCFLDDEMHQLLGLRDQNYQSLYHFTAGGPTEDSRLQTIPAYAHLPIDRR